MYCLVLAFTELVLQVAAIRRTQPHVLTDTWGMSKLLVLNGLMGCRIQSKLRLLISGSSVRAREGALTYGD
jgi:hypothetical protein